MPTVTLSATPKGNGYQATVTFSDGVSISSAETYPTIAEAMTAAALKLLDMRERLEALDCQIASKRDPLFASNSDPFGR
ncbi:MAG: hypothetical protein PHZ23_12100 [Acidiphilium sp.]|nr:hypothetical protein [Acidiphilium sp.]